MSNYSVVQYPIDKYNFVGVVSDLFGISDLKNIYDLSDEIYGEQFKVGMDSSTEFHKKFYEKFRGGWFDMVDVYERFIRQFVSASYDEDFLYQAFPTFRVHLNGNVAVGAFHNDGDFGHPEGEVNYIIPLTNSEGTASVWLESEPGKEDFQDIKMKVGELVSFNGNKLTHGNKTNMTGNARVSMDFRILPISKYDEHNESESITRHTKFKEGEYYKRFTHANV